MNQPWIKETVKCKNANVVGTRIAVSCLPPVPKFQPKNIAQKKSAGEPEKESGTGRSWHRMKITEMPAEMPRRIGERKILIIANNIEPAKKACGHDCIKLQVIEENEADSLFVMLAKNNDRQRKILVLKLTRIQ